MDGFLVLLLWFTGWAILGAFCATRLGNSQLQGAVLGFVLGPIGCLLAFTMGGALCPACRTRMHKLATTCPGCRAELA